MNEYFDVKTKECKVKHEISELQNWMVPTKDRGTWSYDDDDRDGPVADWLEHHRHKWFKYIKNYDIAIQCGGALGIYPRMLAEKFKAVYTFEPTPIAFHCLVNNNQRENVIKIQACLGDEPKFVCMSTHDTNIGLSQVIQINKEGEIGGIPMLTIDQFHFPRCNLIALDAEAYEDRILFGAKETIIRHEPVIVVEINGSQDSVRKFLSELGYYEAEKSAVDMIYVKSSS